MKKLAVMVTGDGIAHSPAARLLEKSGGFA